MIESGLSIMISKGGEEYNLVGIGINVIGSVNYSAKQAPSKAQQYSLNKIIRHYMLKRYPNTDLVLCGHNQLNPKQCPGFDVRAYAQELGLDPSRVLQDKILMSSLNTSTAISVYQERGRGIAKEVGPEKLATMQYDGNKT